MAIRHGEEPAAGLGQLDCKGLNRALALPHLLIARFGKPDVIYALDPTQKVHDGSQPGPEYTYARPFVTIEPTAIALGLPVHIQIGFAQIARLHAALTAPTDALALIFVSWEHGDLHRFAQPMLKTYGMNPNRAPAWPESDYGRICVFTLSRAQGKPALSFPIEREGLTAKLGNTCPRR